MRVLWITNLPVAHLRQMLDIPLGQSGGWIEIAYKALKGKSGLSLGVATIYVGNTILHSREDENDFYAVPSKRAIGDYNYQDDYNLMQWRSVLNDFRPDVIQIWGTEYSIGLSVQIAAKEIPSVVYIQGLVTMIAKHCMDGVSIGQQIRNASMYELLKHKCLWQQKQKFAKAAILEKKILNNACAVIVESDWCGGICSMIAPGIKIYKSDLPINPVFSKYNWDYDRIEKHSIFTVAGGYPVKGHHILLKALGIVKKEIPDVKLYIPGESRLIHKRSLKDSIQISSYDRILNKMVQELELQDNLILLGKLTPTEMAQKMSKCHIFVMPSMIENHSSSLIEAMMVGLPTVSAFVGGINSYYKDRENGLFYRADEPQHLAALIIECFKDRTLCMNISRGAQYEQRRQRQSIDLERDFMSVYKSINPKQ